MMMLTDLGSVYAAVQEKYSNVFILRKSLMFCYKTMSETSRQLLRVEELALLEMVTNLDAEVLEQNEEVVFKMKTLLKFMVPFLPRDTQITLIKEWNELENN
jgi:hypothetical protein